MNILISGASGFIGQHLCGYLKRNSHTVFGIARNIQNQKYFEVDLRNKNSIDKILLNLNNEKIDVIIHLAAKLMNIYQTEEDHMQVLFDNILITQNMINLTKKLKPQKLINFSSMAVYPNIDGIFDEKSQIKMSENTDCMYGLAKFCTENMFDFFLKGEKISVLHLRVAQVYGEGMYQDRIIPVMRKELKEKKTITIFGNGERTSDFIDVNKLIKIVGYLIDLPDVCGVYNVSGENLSYLQLAERIIEEKKCSNAIIIKKSEGQKTKFRLNTDKLSKQMKGRIKNERKSCESEEDEFL